LATSPPTVDRGRSAERIERDIETLAGPDYTRSDEAIRRYAYTPEYRATLDYFVGELEALGFEISYDPVGTLLARNRPAGEPAFGIGSHCDSNRNGGKYDGTMGVVTALEVCRLNAELGLDLPLQLISFLEEEGSGFGQIAASGSTRRRPATSRRAGARRSASSTASRDGSSSTSSKPASSRTRETAWESLRPSPATSTPTSSSRVGPTMPARPRWTSGSTSPRWPPG
jgi:hypothetical protein